MDTKLFGQRIRLYRRLQEVSQWRLARALTVPKCAIMRIERGHAQPNDAKTILAAAKLLNVPMEDGDEV